MADKAIYSVDTVTSMSGTDKVYVNTGNNIKQITKDNLCGNDIKGIKANLSDYGLNNVFDGELRNGFFSDNGAAHIFSENEVCGYSLTPCSAGDVVTIKNNIAGKEIYLKFFDSNNTILAKQSTTDNEITMIAPTNSAKFAWSIVKTNITPNQAGHIGVYVNNQIDGLIITKNFTKNVGTSSSPATDNVDYDLATDVNLYGYKPIGIINVRLKNSDCSSFHLYGFNIDDNGIAYIRTRSEVSGTSSTDLVAEFTVMYIKS